MSTEATRCCLVIVGIATALVGLGSRSGGATVSPDESAASAASRAAPEEVYALLSEYQDPRTAERATRRLVEMGPSVLPLLETFALGTSSPEARTAAVRLIRDMGATGAKIDAPMRSILAAATSTLPMRLVAMQELVARNDPLAAGLAEQSIKPFAANADPLQREFQMLYLNAKLTGMKGTNRIDALLLMLFDDRLTTIAGEGLVELGLPAVTSVAKMLTDSDVPLPVRLRAVQVLLAIGSSEATPALVAVAIDPGADLHLRAAAVGTLGSIGDQRAIPTLDYLSTTDSAPPFTAAYDLAKTAARAREKILTRWRLRLHGPEH